MKRFGRARDLTRIRRAAWVALDFGYRGGWAASLARRFFVHGRICVRKHEARIARWKRGKPLRIVFASDFHAGPVTHPELLNEASRAIAGGKPDLLLLGGDFISPFAQHIDGLAGRLTQIDAPLGKFAVLGNHDLIADDEYIVEGRSSGRADARQRECAMPAPYEGSTLRVDDCTTDRTTPTRCRGATVAARVMHAPEGLLALTARSSSLSAVTRTGQMHYRAVGDHDAGGLDARTPRDLSFRRTRGPNLS